MDGSFPPPAAADRTLLEGAGRCVACGLCLPVCPTYRKTLLEADSPRGRIALMRGLLEGQLAPAPRLLAHLDQCLSCRACERACPSRVPYGELIAGVRARLPRRGHWWKSGLTSRGVLWLAGGWLQVWRALGQPWRGRSRWLGWLAARVPLRPVARLPDDTGERGEVALLLGCVARVTDRPALAATQQLLRLLGYRVRVPSQQGCCGALNRQNGDAAGAARRLRRLRRVFAPLATRPLLHVSGACGQHLAEHGFRAQEALDFIMADEGLEHLRFRPLVARVAIHRPCSGQLDVPQVAALLGRIPGLQLDPLPGNDQCCGGAGWYPLQEPVMAGALLQDKVSALARLWPDIVVTTSPGCALQLSAAAGRLSCPPEVMHPLELLARQVEGAGLRPPSA